VHLSLQPPRGLFAGAYRKEIELAPGSVLETIRIPFSISNLFELGIHPVLATLSVDGYVVAADTARVRIASCQVSDDVDIGFLPDSTGALEDVLHMTDAAVRPLTDRDLITAELDAYDVIIIGSGSFRSFPSLWQAKRRLEDYVRHGGVLVVMSQPEDWPAQVLPVSLTPITETVAQSAVIRTDDETRILTHPYRISERNLFAYFSGKRRVHSAIVTPAEEIYRTGSGGALLSVTQLGDGKLIYCGLPLLDMISDLRIDAIHLLANILNY
jgi:hypothetical protein